MKSILFALVTLCLVAIIPAQAQIKTPAASPMCKFTQTVGLTEVTIEYSRPSKKDREIYGGLVPFDKMWRTGANASTKISFSGDVMLNGSKVLKGKYALYTIPGADGWTIVIHKNLTHWGVGEYNQDEDVLRFEGEPSKLSQMVETFTISIGDLTGKSGMVHLDWENTRVSFQIEADADKKVMTNIEKVMAGPSSGDYYRAASYYFHNGKDLNQALAWVQKTNEGGEKFWMMSLQGEIQAKLGKMKDASMSAQKAMRLAEEAGNDSYVAANKKRLQEWAKKKK